MVLIRSYNKISCDNRKLMAIPPSIIAAGVGAVGSLFGGFSSQNSSKKMMREQMRWQESMYNRQLADNRENWQMQNEYNSPSNQRKLLEDAGYNPALFGHDLSSGSSADQIASGSMQGAPSFSNMPNVLGDAVNSATTTFAAMENASAIQKNASTNAINSGTTSAYYSILGKQVGQNIEQLRKLETKKHGDVQQQKNYPDAYVRKVGSQEQNPIPLT